jgi:DNA-binding MarR family transcriptional regulator
VFGEGLLEVLAILYLKKSLDLKGLGGILGMTPSRLGLKLQILEASGLVEATPPHERAGQTHYALTHKGTIIARLGEPVFLYLRLADGWMTSAVEEPAAAEGEARDKIGSDELSAGA